MPGFRGSLTDARLEALLVFLRSRLKDSPFLDSWIRIDAKGEITVFTGKAEVGQGIKTAVLQVAAEELDVPFEACFPS